MVAACSQVVVEEKAPEYVAEAPLPEGWPTPGPYNQVAEKMFPDYRAAVTTNAGNMAFWTLFRHIQKNDIPMTAPVEMEMEKKAEKLEKSKMAFLYQNTKVGKEGADGDRIEVKDVKKTKALAYAWMGNDSKENIEKAKVALDAEAKKRGVKDPSYRLMGYNGPGTPRAKKTWELVLVLP